MSASVGWGLCVPALAEASDVWATCLESLETRGIERQDISCLYRTARRTGAWDEAAEHLATWLDQRIGPDDPLRPWAEFYLGRIDLDRGRASGRHFREAISGFERFGEMEGAFYSWMNLFMIGQRQADFSLAESGLASAERLAATMGREDLLVEVRIQQARLLRRQGKQLARAETLLLEAREKIFPEGAYPSRRDCLNELAGVRYELGAIAAADQTYRDLLALAETAEDTYTAASTLVNRLALQQELPSRYRPRNLVEQARQALEFSRSAGHQRAEALAAMHLGRLLRGAEGADALELCRQRAREIVWAGLDANCLAFQAQQLLEDDPQGAVQRMEDAIALAATSNELWDSLRFWAPRLDVRWRTATQPEAMDDARLMLDAVEVVREQQGSSWGQAGLVTSWADMYDGIIGRLLDAEPPDVSTAFEFRERFRSRLLLEALRRSEAAFELPDSLEQRRHQLFERIGDVQRQLLGSLAAGEALERVELVQQLDALEREETQLEAEFLTAHPRLIVRRPKFVGFEELQASLAPNEAVLVFQLGPWTNPFQFFAGGSWLLTITHGGHRLDRLPEPSEVEPVVEILLDLIERRDPRAVEASMRLYEWLMADALAALPEAVDHLVVLPDGFVHRLPLAMLGPTPDGPILADRFALTLAPSATLWHGWRQRPVDPPRHAALVLADPALPGVSAVENTDTPAERSAGWIAGVLPPALPFARYEGERIRRELGRSVRVLVDDAAGEDALKTLPLREFGILHLAAHAVIDVRRPQRSAVFLASGSGGDDGLLQPREIVELDLDGRLVVLAACQGASGRLLRGEGVMSLARAFFEAGSRAVVGSLWPLRDDEAARFFEEFYAELDRGVNASEALRSAQQALAAEGFPPSAWAGLTILGDGFYRPLPAPPVTAPGILGILGLIGGGLVLWRLWRRFPAG